MSEQTPDYFQIQPEARNSVKLWVGGIAFEVLAFRGALHVIFPSDKVRIEPINNAVIFHRLPPSDEPQDAPQRP